MKNRLLILFVAATSLLISARASYELDRVYGLRNAVAVVINPDQDPVFTEHVENEIIRYLKSRTRFELNSDAFVAFRDEVRAMYLRDSKVSTQDKVEWIRPQIQALKEKGVDTAIVAEVFHYPGQYRITLVMVSTNDLEYIQSKDLVVEDALSLESFTQTVVRGMDELERRIPFDGSIVRRDGFRVVIDRGYPEMHSGDEMVVYTVEKRGDEEIVLEETGIIRVTEVGDQISFGQILVDRKPREVASMNKILFTGSESGGRELAFARVSDGAPKAKELGELAVLLGGTMVTANNLGPGGVGSSQGGKLFPGGALRGEIWLTNRTFITLGIDFGMATLNAAGGEQNSNINDFQLGVAYQIQLGRGERWNPYLRLRTGFGRHSFGVDASADPMAFTSTTYSGILAGAAVLFKIDPKWDTGFNVTTYMFASASESPATSGDVISTSAWEFGLFANHHFNESMDLIARLNFGAYNAEFGGNGSRPQPITSATQSSQGLSFGVAYFF